MRRILPLLLTLLLLTGCKGGEPRQTTPPAAPTPPPAATPTPEVKPAWWVELGMENLPRPGGEAVTLADGTTVRCLGLLDEPDVGLYSLWYAVLNFPTLYLRHGVSFEGYHSISAGAAADLFWDDFDGDGEDELLFTLRDGQRSSLSVARWDEGWTYLPYDAYSADLEAVLTYDYRNRTATVTYGADEAAYTLGVDADGPAAFLTDFSHYSFFNVSGNSISAVFGVGVEVDGEAIYFASVNADVDFDGEGYTLRNLRLIPFAGV